MRLKYYLICSSIIASSHLAYSQDMKSSTISWNAYAQSRFSTNYQDEHTFALRRLKFWANSESIFNTNWGMKVQTTLKSSSYEEFRLQDIYAYYKMATYQINVGQFVPHYSLQRFQSDYKIPFAERSGVIDALIPNGTLGVRDMGIEGNYNSKNGAIQMWIGFFNGGGIKDYKTDNKGFMFTNKMQANLIHKSFLVGYSFMYRKANDLKLSHILPADILFSGNDIRFNISAWYNHNKIQIQSEYLFASLNQQKADGYYLLANYKFNKNQFSISYNKYHDLITTNHDLPELHLAYNYSVRGDKYKWLLDNGFSLNRGNIYQFFTSLQLQIFFK